MKLALDHHYSTAIAEQLRNRGHDVVAAIEQEWHLLSDAHLLDECAEEERALLTNNVADFMLLVREFAGQGRSHHGLIFTSDASLPRGKATIGTYVERLDALVSDRSTGIRDQIHWL